MVPITTVRSDARRSRLRPFTVAVATALAVVSMQGCSEGPASSASTSPGTTSQQPQSTLTLGRATIALNRVKRFERNDLTFEKAVGQWVSPGNVQASTITSDPAICGIVVNQLDRGQQALGNTYPHFDAVQEAAYLQADSDAALVEVYVMGSQASAAKLASTLGRIPEECASAKLQSKFTDTGDALQATDPFSVELASGSEASVPDEEATSVGSTVAFSNVLGDPSQGTTSASWQLLQYSNVVVTSIVPLGSAGSDLMTSIYTELRNTANR